METTEMLNKVFQQTRTLLEEDGWCQGQGRDPKGHRCLSNALITSCRIVLEIAQNKAESDQFFDWDEERDLLLYQEAQKVLRHIAGAKGYVYQWNDVPGRTIDDVMTVLVMSEAYTTKREETQ